jgi:hypothetical protein
LHLKNIYASGELVEAATIEDFSVVQQEGPYNLDAITSVGYRVNSKRGTQFRQWATTILRDHLIQEWTLDRTRPEHNATKLETALKLVKKALQLNELTPDNARGLVQTVSRYTKTFLLLQRYDEGLLTDPSGTIGGVTASLVEVKQLSF